MRQAGRYLPEFRDIRSKNTDFIKLCLDSKLSSEITLQPIKRFDLDSAIIFSDILITPFVLGQTVNFKKNQSPSLSNFNQERFLDNSTENFSNKLESIYKAIEITRKKLDKGKSLIAFVGAPWTLLIYMLDLKQDKRLENFEILNNQNLNLNRIIEELIKYLCIHIKNQIEAGADVVQIFDSWAGLIPENYIKDYCFKPNAKIVEFCRKEKIPNICFPKGIKNKYVDFNNIVKPDGLSLDSEINPQWAKKKLLNVVIQGGLNPNVLLRSKDEMFGEAIKYIRAFKNTPYIFNLGHGLLPETEPDKVDKLVKFYRSFNE
tara:strand:+ start:7941 stop:8894 length:954 start_codon:yes stop_codon:yes gene_type:complete